MDYLMLGMVFGFFVGVMVSIFMERKMIEKLVKEAYFRGRKEGVEDILGLGLSSEIIEDYISSSKKAQKAISI